MEESSAKRFGRDLEFVNLDDGSVTDTRTGLIWMQPLAGQGWDGDGVTGEPSMYDLSAVRKICRSFAGDVSWRLPTVAELSTLGNRDSSNSGSNAFSSGSQRLPVNGPNIYFKFWSDPTGQVFDFRSMSVTDPHGVGFAFVRLVRDALKFPLTLKKCGSGEGTVTRNPHADTYNEGCEVILRARPDERSRFVGWHGDAKHVSVSCTVLMNSQKTVIAEFSLLRSLTLSVAPTGSKIRSFFRGVEASRDSQKSRTLRLIKATSEASKTPNEDGEVSPEKVDLLQRIARLEDSLQEMLRRLDSPQTSPPRLSRAPAPSASQTLPEVLAWLCTQASVPRAALRLKLLPLDLMPSAIIDEINERAYDLTGEAALDESGEAVIVHRGALLQVLAAWGE